LKIGKAWILEVRMMTLGKKSMQTLSYARDVVCQFPGTWLIVMRVVGLVVFNT
jgi:hypothetical protein